MERIQKKRKRKMEISEFKKREETLNIKYILLDLISK